MKHNKTKRLFDLNCLLTHVPLGTQKQRVSPHSIRLTLLLDIQVVVGNKGMTVAREYVFFFITGGFEFG